MCGRYADPREEDIIEAFDVQKVTARREASRAIAPTDLVRIVVEDAAAAKREERPVVRELRLARWGLVPSWAKALDKRNLLINARAETVTVKPSFRVAAARRRAIVPAIGYYEWTTENGRKIPYFLHAPDDSVLGFAGLYEWWRVPEGLSLPGVEDGWLCSMTIITRPAADDIGQIHDRMPVVVPPALVDTWLDPALTDPAQVEEVLAAVPNPQLVPTKADPRSATPGEQA